MKSLTWTNGKARLGNLVDYDKNPVQLTKHAAQELAKSLKKFGHIIPYTAAAPKNGRNVPILDGHQRKKVEMELLGVKPETMVEIRYPSRKLTDKERQEIIVRLRKNVGEWDFDILANNFDTDDLLDWGFTEKELQLEGFEFEDESRDAEPQIERAEELLKKWKVVIGDLFSVGSHKLLCGNSAVREDVEKVMGIEKATLMFTDPPYGVSIGDKNKFLNKFSKSGLVLTSIESDDDSAEDLGDMLLQVFTLSKDFLADDCSVFVCSPQGGSLGMMMMMMMRDAGLEVRHVLNWVKNSPTFSLGRLDYDYQHEPILFTWIKKHKKIMGGQFKSSVWNVNKPMANKEHANMKPVELYINALLNHTDSGDILYEPFGGSGTGMVASENTGRICRMIELTPQYCSVILERMATAFPDIKIEKIK